MLERLATMRDTRSIAYRIHKRVLTLSSSAALLSLAVLSNLQAAEPPTGKQLNEQLGCAGCHGDNGMGVRDEIPNLAGQDWSYLVRQIKAFADPQAQERPRAGDTERHHAGMEVTTRALSYGEIETLVDYYAGLSCIPKDPDISAAPKAVKPCARCHGAFGINIEPGVPNLAGQKVAYLTAQLRAFRASLLGTDPFRSETERYHQVMAEHAVSLSDEDIDRIAVYFANLGCS
jgi:cytochrome c553